jgi:hypothetical protein
VSTRYICRTRKVSKELKVIIIVWWFEELERSREEDGVLSEEEGENEDERWHQLTRSTPTWFSRALLRDCGDCEPRRKQQHLQDNIFTAW